MKIYSNIPLPTEQQKWNDTQWVHYYNHADSGEDGGSRYSADMVIINDLNESSINQAIMHQSIIWHKEDKPIQVVISESIKRNLLMLNQENQVLGNHQDVAMLLDYVKGLSAFSVNEYGNLYIYLSELFSEHKAFLESFGIKINTRP